MGEQGLDAESSKVVGKLAVESVTREKFSDFGGDSRSSNIEVGSGRRQLAWGYDHGARHLEYLRLRERQRQRERQRRRERERYCYYMMQVCFRGDKFACRQC